MLNLVRDCALRQSRNSISKQDLFNLVGSIETVPFLKTKTDFQPTPYDDKVAEVLNDNHILILIGEPAVGKTSLAKMLVNKLSQNLYELREPTIIDAHLEIFQECRGVNNVVFFLDDPFGYDDVTQSGDVLVKQFSEVVSQVNVANGRVKLIITSRLNTFSQAFINSKHSLNSIQTYICEIGQPDDSFIRNLLRFLIGKHEGDFDEIETILELFPSEEFRFENLLHVEEFATKLGIAQPRISYDSLNAIFQDTRPSLYHKWIETQSSVSSVFLFTLWAVQEVNQFAYERDFERIFNKVIENASLSPLSVFETHFDKARKMLVNQQRIAIRSGRIDFIHPLFKQAVLNFFSTLPSIEKRIVSMVEALKDSQHPLDQSIAVMLALRYHNAEKFTPSFFYSLLQSPFLHTRDTFVRFGTHLLTYIDEDQENEWGKLAGQIYSRHYSPANCEIDYAGNVVFKGSKSEETAFRSIGDILEESERERGLDYPNGKSITPETIDNLKRCFDNHDYSTLNPIQRYIFVGYLTASYLSENTSKIISLLTSLAYDPIAFVRLRIAKKIHEIVLRNGLDSELTRILKILSFDSSPYVKISMLESIVIDIWASQPFNVQNELFSTVCSMLDDPVVREQTAKGLLGQSGTLYRYHAAHSANDKKRWFEAIAIKLLEYNFRYDDFDRFLDAFDDHYFSFDTHFRVKLLMSLKTYNARTSRDSISLIIRIVRIIFNKDVTNEEKDVILALIAQIDPFAKACLINRLSLRFGELDDDAFCELVYREFSGTSTTENRLIRVASVLGYLGNESQGIDQLPFAIKQCGESRDIAIQCYIKFSR